MDYASYFDARGRQTRPLPKKLTDLSRFRVGERIEFLRERTIATTPDGRRISMAGQIGVVEKLHESYGSFPPRWINDANDTDGGGFWDCQHEACLAVRFPVSPYRMSDGSYGAMALHLSDEGKSWRKVK